MPIIAPWRFLAGFYPEADALALVRGQYPLDESALGTATEAIRSARTFVGQLSPRVDDVTVEPIRAELQAYLSSVETEPTFAEHLQGMTGHEFGFLPVKKLGVFQPMVNLEYADRIIASMPAIENDYGLLQFCIPLEGARSPDSVLTTFDAGRNLLTVIVDNLDYRVLGLVQGKDDHTGRQFAGFAFGGGLRQMSVVEYRGRYIIKNGYHRAFALAKAGHERVPALIVHTDRYVNTGGNAPAFLPVDVVTGQVPPRIEDFLSAASIDIQRYKQKMLVTMQAGVQTIPV